MILIASMFLVSIGYTMVIPFLPLYLLDIGVPEESIAIWTGVVFSSCFLVAGIMGPVWGKMADTRGKKQMAIRAAVLLGFSYLFCGLSQNAWQMTAARAFMGFSNGFVAASMAIISVSADPKNLGATLGMGQTALIVGGLLWEGRWHISSVYGIPSLFLRRSSGSLPCSSSFMSESRSWGW